MSYLSFNDCHKKEKYTLGAFGSYQKLMNERKFEPKKRYIYECQTTNSYVTITDNDYDNSQIKCFHNNNLNLKHY